MTKKTVWCSMCDEIEATTQKSKRSGLFTLCVNCEQVMYYWKRKSPAALIDRRAAVKLALRRNSLLLGEMNVEDIEDTREKKKSA